MSRFRGSLDVPLNEQGWIEAIKAGFALKDAGIELIIHDSQQRTRNTAECIQLLCPNAELGLHDVHSQRLGWLEGKEVTEDTLNEMRYYVTHPTIIPHPGFNPESEPPQCFQAWLAEWFWVYDNLKRYADIEKLKTLIVTHNRNIQAVLSRRGNWIDFEEFDVPGPRPCEIVHASDYLTLIRHGDTDFGT